MSLFIRRSSVMISLIIGLGLVVALVPPVPIIVASEQAQQPIPEETGARFNASLLDLSTKLSNLLDPDNPRGMEALTNFNGLPNFREDSIVKQVASTDPKGANIDVYNWLYKLPSGEFVILDETGPGIVYNSWMTLLPGGNIRFYFDGATQPQINVPVADFFNGKTAPFNPPFAYTASIGNANNCFNCKATYFNNYPLAFEKSVRVTLEFTPGYYHFYVRNYNSSTGIKTYTGKENTDGVRQLWSKVGSDPKNTDSNTVTKNATPTFAKGKEVTLLDTATPGSIRSLALRPSAISEDVLLNLRLQIFWDNQASPSVDTPVGFFFGGGTTLRPFKALMSGMPADGLFYNYFPMPFWKRALVKLVNNSDTPVAVQYEIQSSNVQYTKGRAGYFNATYTSTPRTTPGQDYIMLEAKGRGTLVGLVMSTRLTGEQDSWWEGDERFFIDGSATPQFNGTGSEDIFNLAFEPLSFWQSPLSGSVTENASNDGKPDANMIWYRHMLADSISWQYSLKAGFEVGPTNNIAATDRRMMALWYGLPDTPSLQSDQIEFGNPTSEQSHNYRMQSQVNTGLRSGTYLGDPANTTRSFFGRSFKGESSFSVKVNSLAKSVVLRRRLDFSKGNQLANVYVNGTLAGVWQDMGVNDIHIWRESEFILPQYLTLGRDKLDIRIEVPSANQEWNEYGYFVVCQGNFLER